MRARPVTAFALTRYAHAQPVPRSPAGDPHLAWAHENGLVGRERINRSDEAGDFTGLTRPTRNLFRTARAYREWARELSETDATWEAFERMRQARWNARHRALHAGQRDHNVEGAGRLLPCETTALDSSRVQPARRDSLPLLDRMPALARRTPLTPTLAVFETFTMEKEPRQYRDSSSGQMRTREYNVRSWAAAPTTVGAARVPRRPSEAEGVQYRRLCLQNATCFNNLEAAHPINFFEQRDVCMNCGAERFTVTNPSICCQNGSLVLDRQLPNELLSLISEAPGFSKQSRAGNDLFRFAQMALPKGTHRFPDSYQHLKVTGMPFAIISNINERSSTRSFLDDPNERLDDCMRYSAALRPSPAALATIDAVMRRENALVPRLINWAEESTRSSSLMVYGGGGGGSPFPPAAIPIPPRSREVARPPRHGRGCAYTLRPFSSTAIRACCAPAWCVSSSYNPR